MPHAWHWTDAFVKHFREDVAIVACSIACLPSIDAGGYGPKVCYCNIDGALQCPACSNSAIPQSRSAMPGHPGSILPNVPRCKSGENPIYDLDFALYAG